MPAGVEAEVVTESVEVDVAGFGLNVPFAPAGNPLTPRVTPAEKPPDGVTVTV